MKSNSPISKINKIDNFMFIPHAIFEMWSFVVFDSPYSLMLRNTFEDQVTYSQNFTLFLFGFLSLFSGPYRVLQSYLKKKKERRQFYVEVNFSCYLWNVKAWLRKFRCFRFTLFRDVAQYLWGSRNILSELIVFIPSLFGFMSLFFGLYRVL